MKKRESLRGKKRDPVADIEVGISVILSEILKSSVSSRLILSEIVEQACKLTGCSSSIIYPYDPDRHQFYDLKNVASYGTKSKLRPKDKQRTKSLSTLVLKKNYYTVPNVIKDKNIRNSKFLSREGVKAFVGVALKIGRQEFGVLFFNFLRPKRFSKKMQFRIKMFIPVASLALKFARMKKRLEESVEASKILFKLTQDIESLVKLDEILNKLAELCVKHLIIDAVTIYVVNKKTGNLKVPIFNGVKNVDLMKGPIIRNSVAGKLILQGKKFEAENVDKSDLKGPFTTREGIKSAVFLPLKVGEEILGGMFFNFRQLRTFPLENMIFYENFASIAGIAIKNSIIYENVDEALVKKNAELEMLRRLDRQILQSYFSSSDLVVALEPVLEQAMKLTNSSTGNITWMDPSNKELIVLVPESQFGKRQKIGTGAVGIVAETKKPLRIQNLSDPKWKEIYIQFVDKPMLSELAVPLLSDEGRLVGVINVENKEENAFSEEHENILFRLSNQVSLAILVAERNEKLINLQRSLISAMEVAIKGIMFTDYGHNVQSITSSIRTNIDLLEMEKNLSATASDALNRIKFDNAILSEKAPRYSPLSTRDHIGNLNTILKDEVNRLSKKHPELKINLELKDLPDVVFHHILMSASFSSIIQNAFESMKNEKEKEISVKTMKENENIYVEVVDNGCGVPPAIKDDLYHISVTSAKNPRSSGLGSIIVNLMLTWYDGKCTVSNNAPKGTIVLIELPISKMLRKT